MSVIQPTAAKSPAISAATAPRVWLKAVLISAVPPLLLQTAANPGGLPMEACDQIRSAVLADRAQFFKDISLPFYGYNRPHATVSPGVRDSF
jgi:non-heme chloroperoxidase